MPDTASPPTAESLIAGMKSAGLLDPAIEAAFRAVPRAAFLPGLTQDEIYKDEAVPIKVDEDGTVLSSSSQPSMMAIMLRQLQLRSGMNVLEVGTGTGYNAALIRHIVGDEGKVTSIEIDGAIIDNARANLQRTLTSDVMIVHGDGSNGFAPRASYDRIIATAGIWDVPEAWVRQMKPKSILVAPLWVDGFEVSAAFMLQRDGSLYSEDNRLCGFVRLRGQASGPEHSVRIGTSGLYLYANRTLDSAAMRMLFSDDADETFINVPLDAIEYWQGFLPYLVIHVPETLTLARYVVTQDAPAYGIGVGSGFALIGQGSACFVTIDADRNAKARCFGSVDALMAIEEVLAAWERAGMPQHDRLRLRLIPKTTAPLTVDRGRLYRRRDHDLHVWLETGERNG